MNLVAIDLLKNLLCDSSIRIDAAAIKKHPFFDGFDWDNVRSMKAPFQPQLKDELDTAYFDEFNEVNENLRNVQKNFAKVNLKKDENLLFENFTFKREDRKKSRTGLKGLFEQSPQ